VIYLKPTARTRGLEKVDEDNKYMQRNQITVAIPARCMQKYRVVKNLTVKCLTALLEILQ